MNKGLEVIEAHHLFSLPVEKIDVIIHPQSIIHSLVEFKDGSILAQMSEPNMEMPILYALSYPERLEDIKKPFNFELNSKLEFFKPDFDKFKCLHLAYRALKDKSSMACYMNSANEVLVNRFLRNEITWIQISEKLEKLIASHKSQNMLDLKAVLEIDQLARADAEKI